MRALTPAEEARGRKQAIKAKKAKTVGRNVPDSASKLMSKWPKDKKKVKPPVKKKVKKNPTITKPKTSKAPVLRQIETLDPMKLILNRQQANANRRGIREATSGDLGKKAYELHQTLGSWEKVAEAIGYANGAIARRAALKYLDRAGL